MSVHDQIISPLFVCFVACVVIDIPAYRVSPSRVHHVVPDETHVMVRFLFVYPAGTASQATIGSFRIPTHLIDA